MSSGLIFGFPGLRSCLWLREFIVVFCLGCMYGLWFLPARYIAVLLDDDSPFVRDPPPFLSIHVAVLSQNSFPELLVPWLRLTLLIL